jgi:hypothetical protein
MNPKQLQRIPTIPKPVDSAALQFALHCVQLQSERNAGSAVVDPMADRAMAELERLISRR